MGRFYLFLPRSCSCPGARGFPPTLDLTFALYRCSTAAISSTLWIWKMQMRLTRMKRCVVFFSDMPRTSRQCCKPSHPPSPPTPIVT